MTTPGTCLSIALLTKNTSLFQELLFLQYLTVAICHDQQWKVKTVVMLESIKSLILLKAVNMQSDISRTNPSPSKGLPRFNMPLELGLFLGAKYYGNKHQKGKGCLILDKERYRYQIFISDIAGQDIRDHDNQPEKAIMHVRDWLRSHHKDTRAPGGQEICNRYHLFCKDLPEICRVVKQSPEDLTFNDYINAVSYWLKLKENFLHPSF